MPTVGSFHAKFWKARANTPPPAGTPSTVMGYPAWQSSIVIASALFWLPWDAIRPYWHWAKQCWDLAKRLWTHRVALDWWMLRVGRWSPEQWAVVERVIAAVESPAWVEAQRRVRACATTQGFNHPEAWIPYSRLVKANLAQTQNVFRHMKAVFELKDAQPTLTNPEAHLLIELAYQGFAATGRADRVIVHHAHI